MSWRCRIFGHADPRWLDYQHQGHCPRCREPHPRWIKEAEHYAALRAAFPAITRPYRSTAPETTTEERCWWSMSGDAFIAALRQAHAGEDPELVYAEWYANGEVEKP